MKLTEAFNILNDNGYQMLNEWKITSDFDELSAEDKKRLTSAMNGAYTAIKSKNKKKLIQYTTMLAELSEKIKNPKAKKAILRMIDKMDAVRGIKTDTATDTKAPVTDIHDRVKSYLKKLIDKDYCSKAGDTLVITSIGKDFLRKKFGKASGWYSLAQDIKSLDKIDDDVRIWLPRTDSGLTDVPSWTWFRVTSFGELSEMLDRAEKFFFDSVSTTDKASDIDDDTAGDTITIELLNDAVTCYNKILTILQNKKYLDWDDRAERWGLTDSGKSILDVNIDDVMENWTCLTRTGVNHKVIPAGDFVWAPLKDHDWTYRSNWNFELIEALSSKQLTDICTAFGIKIGEASSSTSKIDDVDFVLANINNFLLAMYKKGKIIKNETGSWDLSDECKIEIGTKFGLDWDDLVQGVDFDKVDVTVGKAVDKYMSYLRMWLPHEGVTTIKELKDSSNWTYFAVDGSLKDIIVDQCTAAAKLFDVIFTPAGASASKVRSKAVAIEKPKAEPELPETINATEYHFMISFTLDDTDEDETMDKNLKPIMDMCDDIEKNLAILNKAYEPYGLKCSCDWDNDDAHYFYGKFWKFDSYRYKGLKPANEAVDKIYDHLFHTSTISSNPRLIDIKAEKLREYKAHLIG